MVQIINSILSGYQNRPVASDLNQKEKSGLLHMDLPYPLTLQIVHFYPQYSPNDFALHFDPHIIVAKC